MKFEAENSDFFPDEIHFGEGREDMVDNIIGGAGTYGLWPFA